jgi:diguanylate cyclase (GGDEF)-like protein
MMRNVSIEIKMIISVILFTLFIVGLERYQLSENIMEQFVASKQAKNRLLIETVAPIISLNFSLGLMDANTEYLNQIVKQNSDLDYVSLVDAEGNMMYEYSKNSQEAIPDDYDHNKVFTKKIIDSLTNEMLGIISLHFFNGDYQIMRAHSQKITLQIFAITMLSLSLFVLLIRREFKHLKRLSESVLDYNPKKNNFALSPSNRRDEVGVINNAIVSMVEKIDSHAKMLDELNLSLEQKVQKRTKELEEANKKLQALSTTDQLTQLANRRHFQEHILSNWDLARREGVYLSVIMADIDFFKKINDTHGHLAGDTVLREIASAMKKSLKRTTDFIARYGGEEFIVVLYDTDLQKANEVCETMQSAIAAIDCFEHQGIKIAKVSMSFGVCSCIPTAQESYETLIKCSDNALYQAKEEGRDRIVLKSLS